MRTTNPSMILRWLAGGALLLSPVAAAQAPEAPEAPEALEGGRGEAAAQEEGSAEERSALASSAEEDARELRRVLRLHGGATVRAVTRLTDAGWQYRAGPRWETLPAAAVAEALLEKDLLREARLREKALAGLDPAAELAARVETAAWMLASGLLEEGLGELGRVLAADADHRGAREALIAHQHRFQVPRVDARGAGGADEWREVVAWATGRPATLREMALVELAKVRDRDGLLAHLRVQLHDGVSGRRSFATLALRRLFPGEELQPLLQRAVLDSSAEVRAGAGLALADFSRPELILPVVKAMNGSASPLVRVQAAEALGHMGYAAAVPPLVARLATLQGARSSRIPHSNIFIGRQFAYIQDFDVEVAQFQAVADPQINVMIEGQATDAGVVGVQQVSYTVESRHVRDSLRKLTGADPGRSARDWLEWWDEHGGDWSGELER